MTPPKPKAVRMAWRLPHFTIRARASGVAVVMAIRRLFVGMITRSVKGRFASIKTAPTA